MEYSSKNLARKPISGFRLFEEISDSRKYVFIPLSQRSLGGSEQSHIDLGPVGRLWLRCREGKFFFSIAI